MISFFKDWYMRNLSNPAAIILILQFITAFVILYFFSNVFGTLVAALVLAFMLERPVSFLIKHGTSRLGATILVMLCYIVFFICLFVAVIPPAAEQLTRISTSISETLTEISNHGENANIQEILKEKIVMSSKNTSPESNDIQRNNLETDTLAHQNDLASSETEISENAETALTVEETSPIIQNSDINANNGSVAVNEPSSAQEEKKSGYEPKRMNDEDKQESTATISWLSAKLQQLTDKLPKAYKDLLSDQQMKEYAISFMRTVKGWVTPFITTKIAPLFMDMLSFVVYFIIVPIFAFYMLKDKDKFLSLSKKYLCSHEEVTSFWAEMNILISKYLNGKCIHVIIIFLVNWIAFSILGLNYGLLLAIGVGLSVIIPYVGMIIITIPIVIIGLIQFGLSGDMVWLIAIYTIIQILDGYVLTPMLFSETLNLDPFSILVAIVVFGGLLGFWGVVLAIPLATFVKTIFTKWPVNRKYIESKKLEAKSIS